MFESDEVPDKFESEVRRFNAENTEANRGDAEWLARLAILGVGLNVYGRARGRNYFADAMDIAGRGARYLGRLGRQVEPEFATETADMLYKTLGIHPDAGGRALTLGIGGARIGELDSLQDLASAMNILQRPELHSNTEQVTELLARHFNRLPRSGGSATPSVLHHDLQPLTFGELLSRNNEWIEEVGSVRLQTTSGSGRRVPLSLGIVEKAIENKWIHLDTIVDSNVFISKGAGGRIVDMRLTNPRAVVEAASKIIDIAGVFKATASFMNSKRSVALVKPGPTRNARVFIGGDVFEVSREKVSHIAKKQTLGRTGDKRFEAAMLREASEEGRIKSVYSEDKGSGFLNSLQEATGVGTKFHDKRGLGIPFAKTVLDSVAKVGRGEALFLAKDYKKTTDTLKSRAFGQFVPEVDLVTEAGEQFVKGKFHGQGYVHKDQLTRLERLKAYMGMNEDVVLVDASARDSVKVGKQHLVSGYNRGSIESLDVPIGKKTKSQGPTGVDSLGQLEYTERAAHYATSGNVLDVAKDFGNYMTMRLNALASSTGLGIGFRPSGSLLANTARLAAIPASYMMLAEGLKYANYLTESITGVNPMKAAATTYAQMRIAQQKIREATGIAPAADYAETSLFPGLSIGLIGSIAAAAGGIRALEAGASFMKAGVTAASIYAAVGGPDVGQSSQEIEDIYSGEQKVPIRKSRWWGLGYQPFKGGEIDHFAPSWYRKVMDQPDIKNIYGSESEYWRNSLLPTPHNLFGLKPLLDPYWLEKKHYYDRPYPVTGGILEEVPIFGPILADTIGEVIKPKRKMHAQASMVASSNISERGVPADVATQLGIPDMPGSLVDINRPDVKRDRIEKWANVGLEPTGIWKFALEFFGVSFDDGYKLADAGNMGSISRSFYNRSLGGLGGQTEFIRRFLMSDYGDPNKINNQINPIPNTMPRWLPGSMSENKEDRSYYVDFTRGDAYTKILGGEYRLPGAGYEAVNRLHSGQSGVYDEVDKLMVLSDVAPHSTAFHTTRASVESMNLSPYWRAKVNQALGQREEKNDIYGFNSQDIVAKANLNPISQSIRGVWDAAYSIGGEIPLIGSKFMPKRNPIDHYVKFQVEGDSFANWNRPYETIIRPALYDAFGSDPVMGTAKGALLGGLLAAPFAKYLTPFMPATVSMGANAAIGGLIGGAGSTARMFATGNTSGGFIPPHVNKEREVKEYFDYLQYAKYRGLANMAEGNKALQHSLLLNAERTSAYGLANLRSKGDDTAYSRSLGKQERAYYEAFKAAPAASRDRILSNVPGHMKSALSSIWGDSSYAGGNPHQNATEQTSEYFEDHTMPSPDWAGWHPSVPMSAIRIKSVEAGINGVSDAVHRFGYYPVQQREVSTRFPFLQGISSIRNMSTRNIFSSVYDAFGEYLPFGDMQSLDMGTGPSLDFQEYNIYDERRDDVFEFMRLYN